MIDKEGKRIAYIALSGRAMYVKYAENRRGSNKRDLCMVRKWSVKYINRELQVKDNIVSMPVDE
jgi:hypothetical protein